MFYPYRGRSHTNKQNSFKPKISFVERKKRSARKKLLRLFPKTCSQCYQYLLITKINLTNRLHQARE